MRTLDEVVNQLSYHAATAETAPLHDEVRQTLRDCAEILWRHIPDGPEKTLSMRALQQCGMYANLAIALTAPVVETPQSQRTGLGT